MMAPLGAFSNEYATQDKKLLQEAQYYWRIRVADHLFEMGRHALSACGEIQHLRFE